MAQNAPRLLQMASLAATDLALLERRAKAEGFQVFEGGTKRGVDQMTVQDESSHCPFTSRTRHSAECRAKAY